MIFLLFHSGRKQIFIPIGVQERILIISRTRNKVPRISFLLASRFRVQAFIGQVFKGSMDLPASQIGGGSGAKSPGKDEAIKKSGQYHLRVIPLRSITLRIGTGKMNDSLEKRYIFKAN
jgi:hypothetical protein